MRIILTLIVVGVTAAFLYNKPFVQRWFSPTTTAIRYGSHAMQINADSMVYDCRLVLPSKSLQLVRK